LAEEISAPLDQVPLGLLLKRLRTEARLARGQLAERVGLCQPQIFRLEGGRQGFRSSTLRRIAGALGYDTDLVFVLREQANIVEEGSMGDGLSAPLNEENIGALIGHVRQQQHLGQTALAKKVGISQAQICRLEQCKQGFRSSTLRKTASALGYDVRVVFVPKPTVPGPTS